MTREEELLSLVEDQYRDMKLGHRVYSQRGCFSLDRLLGGKEPVPLSDLLDEHGVIHTRGLYRD